MAQERTLHFGGIRLAIRSKTPFSHIAFQPSLDTFWTVEDAPIDLDITLRFEVPDEASFAETRLVFDSGGLWQLREDDARLIFVLRGVDGGGLFRVATFNRALTIGEIVSHPAGKPWFRGPLLPDPLEYPLGEALTVCLLATGRGLLVHGCGLERDGRGYLMAGHSGAGKTTLSRLAMGRFRLLNDDRIILRLADGVPWIHGTPWHGDCSEVSAAGAPLHRLRIIGHGPRHKTTPMRPALAAAELLARGFTPVWSAAGMERSMALVDEVLAKVPCSRLEFAPDESVFGELEG